ncbi:MAG: formylglycine-generating enzyme family protein [Chloroflexi bacterium]|nr:MAG: formylglycine-generating enzyme family protein [Chloroflexota bacterium]
MKTSVLVLALAALILTACSADSVFGDPNKPTAVPGNTAWTPVVQIFSGVEMVKVPPGCFRMGHDAGRRDEQPEHKICFDQPFWIDRTEVTNGQYGSAGAFPGDDRPRDNLTWFEARDYCTSRGARLPTEAEWEYAARGPDSTIYPWGDTFNPDALVFDCNFNNELWPVGTFPIGGSWVGAVDMAGNAWEWVNSQYHPYPYQAGDGREDPNNTTEKRVYRGGMGSYIDYGASSATRFRLAPSERAWFVGFRCARDS